MVIQKVKKRLATWKGKLLSKARKAQLIKPVLRNLPMHYLLLFKLPDGVPNKIISLEKRFFWTGEENKKYLASVN